MFLLMKGNQYEMYLFKEYIKFRTDQAFINLGREAEYFLFNI